MISSLDAKKGLCYVASVIAVLALAVAIGTGSASANKDQVHAVAAKKKCKKAKKSATAAKKKCKAKKKSGSTTTEPVTLPGTTTDTTPTSPATLTWDNTAADLDLYVWDASAGGLGGTVIANSSFSGDNTSGGPETFSDQISPHTRKFTYGICAEEASSGTNFTLTVQDQTGASHVFDQDDFMPAGPITSTSVWRKAIFGGFDPDPGNTGNWCP